MTDLIKSIVKNPAKLTSILLRIAVIVSYAKSELNDSCMHAYITVHTINEHARIQSACLNYVIDSYIN